MIAQISGVEETIMPIVQFALDQRWNTRRVLIWGESGAAMNAILPLVAVEQTLARQDSVRRPDPTTLAIIGCAAAVMLAAAALMVALGEAESAGPALGGNVALILFAVMNADRPYRRCWAPGLIFLGLVGASGIALALLPVAEHFVTPSAVARIAIEGLHGLAQLGAMAMMAFAWTTVGRSVRGARWSMAALAMLANLQLGEAAAQALAGSAGDAWTFAGELLFAAWLLATVLGLTRRLGGHIVTDQIVTRVERSQSMSCARSIGTAIECGDDLVWPIRKHHKQELEMSQTQHRTDAVFLAANDRPQDDPMFVFGRWLGEAKSQIGFAASAMSLATVTQSGDPDVRVVLLQSIQGDGLVFFTNLTSPKGKHMLASGKAAACFHWPDLGRQVRIRGMVHQVEDVYADQYFAGRPRGSQIGAHASAQSSVIPDRAALIERANEVENLFAGGTVPRPAHWSGMSLAPSAIEFWEDGADRLHDRMLFTRPICGGAWSAARLAP